MSVWLQNPSPSTRKIGQPQQRKTSSSQQQSQSDQVGTDNAPVVVSIPPSLKTDAESARETEDREEREANDRKVVALSRDLVIATAILAVVGIFQLLVFGDQARQLRRTVKAAADRGEAMERSIKEANRLAEAMEAVASDIEESTKAAIESVAVTRERTAQQMRAYMCVEVGNAYYQERTKDIKFAGETVMINVGNTPAYNLRFRAKAAVLPFPLPDDFPFSVPGTTSSGSVLGPHQKMNIVQAVDDFVPDQEVDNIRLVNSGKALYIWGVIEYADVFKQPQTTRFCQLLFWLPDLKTVKGAYITRHNDAS